MEGLVFEMITVYLGDFIGKMRANSLQRGPRESPMPSNPLHFAVSDANRGCHRQLRFVPKERTGDGASRREIVT